MQAIEFEERKKQSGDEADEFCLYESMIENLLNLKTLKIQLCFSFNLYLLNKIFSVSRIVKKCFADIKDILQEYIVTGKNIEACKETIRKRVEDLPTGCCCRYKTFRKIMLRILDEEDLDMRAENTTILVAMWHHTNELVTILEETHTLLGNLKSQNIRSMNYIIDVDSLTKMISHAKNTVVLSIKRIADKKLSFEERKEMIDKLLKARNKLSVYTKNFAEIRGNQTQRFFNSSSRLRIRKKSRTFFRRSNSDSNLLLLKDDSIGYGSLMNNSPGLIN